MAQLSLLESCLLTLKPVGIDVPLIRIGNNGDGGYLCPDDLVDMGGCISPGAFNIKNFEDHLLADWGIPSLLVDASSTEDGFETPMLTGQFLLRKWLKPSACEDAISLEEALNHPIVDSSKDLLLQLDIEGAEYVNINAWATGLLQRFRIIIVEFHALSALELPWRSESKGIMRAIAKIGATHTCIHLHPNNCCGYFSLSGSGFDIPNVVECTFIRNDRIAHCSPRLISLPSILDHKNVAHLPDLAADKAWTEPTRHFLSRLQRSRFARFRRGLRIELNNYLRRAHRKLATTNAAIR